MSTRSLLSHEAKGSVMSAQAMNAVMASRSVGDQRWPGWVVAASAAGIALLSLWTYARRRD